MKWEISLTKVTQSSNHFDAIYALKNLLMHRRGKMKIISGYFHTEEKNTLKQNVV